MKKKRIMITGHRGFIGSHLVSLLEKDYMLAGIDLKQYTDVFQVDNLHGIDTVVHLAALTNVRESRDQSIRYLKQNILGTAHMLRLCTDYNVKMIYVSSAAVNEPDSSVYAFSKYIAEELTYIFQQATNAVILKPYNVYGLGAPKGSLFTNFLTEKKLTVYGDGKDSRDFINVWDVCRIIKEAIDKDWKSNEAIEVGLGKAYTVKQIAEWFAKYSGKEIIYEASRGGIHVSKANTSLLKSFYKEPFITNIEKDIEMLVKTLKIGKEEVN